MAFRNGKLLWCKQVGLPMISGVADKVVPLERRRYDRATHQEVERRRFPRVEPSEDTYVEDAKGRRLGLVGDISGGGFSVFPENDTQALAFSVGSRMNLTLVGESGSRTAVRATVVYRTAFAIGLEFLMVYAVPPNKNG